MSLVEALAWTAAVAVAMFIAHEEFGLFFPAEEGVTSTVQTGRTEAPTATQSAAPESVAPSPLEAGHLRTTARAKAKRTVPVPRVAADKPPVLAEVPAPDALPVGFRSLMYCDVLSCGGPMQMIRVQLPPSAAGLAPDSVPSNQMVYADVLVGPDGIARGIRILK